MKPLLYGLPDRHPASRSALRRICRDLGVEAGCPPKLQRRRALAFQYVYLLDRVKAEIFRGQGRCRSIWQSGRPNPGPRIQATDAKRFNEFGM